MDTYPQVQQNSMFDPSQRGHYPPQEGYVSQPGNYPATAAPPAFNPSAPYTTHHQGYADQPGNYPIMSQPPSNSPPAPINVVNNQTTVVTQAPAIVSTSYFSPITALNDSFCLCFQEALSLSSFVYFVLVLCLIL